MREAPTDVAGLDDVAVVREPVEQRGRHLRIGEYARPLAEREVGRDDDRRGLVEPADQVEQQLAAGLGERQIAQLVEHQQIDARDAVGDAALAAELDLGLQLVDEIDGIEEARLATGADNIAGDADRDVGLARSSRASVMMPGVWDLRSRSTIRFIPAAVRRWVCSAASGMAARSISSFGSRTAL